MTASLSVLARGALAAALVAYGAAAVAQTAAPPKADKAAAESAFKKADANGDGKLSKEEVATMPAIADKFAALDRNKDGFLTVDEFVVGFTA